MFLLCTFNTMSYLLSWNITQYKKYLHQAHTRRFIDHPNKSEKGGGYILCKPKNFWGPTAGHTAHNRSALKWDAPIAWWNVKGSKCKRVQQCKHKVPHNQSVSTCSDRAISSGHAGHYLTVFWCSEGNLREARARLWLTSEEGKNGSKGAFSSTSPQNINSETVCRPTGGYRSLFAQNKEGRLEGKGFDFVCKG